MIYDLANTIFALGVVGLYLPDWLTSENLADSTLALTQSIAGACVIFLAPWIGARSDRLGRRMPALVITTVIAVVATAGLTWGPLPVTFALLGVALVAVNTGSVVYDALLPIVAASERRGRISGLGVGVGYLGSFVGVGIGAVTLDILEVGYGVTFVALAAAFAVFAIPTFVLIREPAPAVVRPPPPLRSVVTGLAASWRRARAYPNVVRFLIARFLYTDAINTLIGGFLTIFAIEELGLDRQGSQALLLVAITTAIAGGIGGGRLVERLGPVRALRSALVLWIVAILLGVFASVTSRPELAGWIGALGGFALGATWAADRVVMLGVSPPEHLGEFYGLYATVGRFATILGPLMWALIVDGLGLGRNVAMISLAAFVAAGWHLTGRVSLLFSGAARH
ncbi:MAG TPA: MFS transporter [Acidimicrobiia bacterium]|nr:MFS transporter [Acidimicrobiia bacterium]